MSKSVEAAVAKLRNSIEHQRSQGDGRPTTWRKLSTLVSSCGWTNRTGRRMQEVAEAVATAGLYASHDLTDLDLGLDSSIRFSETPWLELAQIFHNERELGYHLSKYQAVLEAALPHFGDLRHVHGGQSRERNYYYQGSAVRPDLVFKSQSGITVVVELERGDPKDESLNQLERYLVAAEAKHGKPIAGVLITAKPRRVAQRRQFMKHLDLLRIEYPNVTWLCYDVQVTLSPAN